VLLEIIALKLVRIGQHHQELGEFEEISIDEIEKFEDDYAGRRILEDCWKAQWLSGKNVYNAGIDNDGIWLLESHKLS